MSYFGYKTCYFTVLSLIHLVFKDSRYLFNSENALIMSQHLSKNNVTLCHVSLFVSSSFHALLVNLDLSFAYSYVLPVLWKVCRLAKTFPTHCLSWCLTRAHGYVSFSLFSLCCLSPSHPLAAAQFLFSRSVLLVFVVSKCCQLSPLSPGRWLSFPCVHPQCPLSCSYCLPLIFFILSIFFSYVHAFFSIISCLYLKCCTVICSFLSYFFLILYASSSA